MCLATTIVLVLLGAKAADATFNFGLDLPDVSKHKAEMKLFLDLRQHYFNTTSHVMPPVNDTAPLRVLLGLSPILISDLDAVTSTLTIQGYLYLGWPDLRYRWNPQDFENVTKLRIPPYFIWKPDVMLYNAARIDAVVSATNVYTVLSHEGFVWWVPPVTLRSICAVDLKYFPYDQHSCDLKFGSWTMDGLEMDLALLGLHMDLYETYDSKGGQWEVVNGSAKLTRTVYECCPEPYPDVTFTLVLRRRSPFYKTSVLIPVLASLVLVGASLLLAPTSRVRIFLDGVALALLVLELAHLSFMVPSVGSDTPIIATFCGGMVVVVTLLTVHSVSVVSFLSKPDLGPLPGQLLTFLHSQPVRKLLLGPAGRGTALFVSFKFHQDTERLDTDDGASRPPDSRDQWISFFQTVDRIAMVAFVVVTAAILLFASF